MRYNFFLVLGIGAVACQNITMELVDLVNKERAKIGLSKLKHSANLSRVAQLHVENLLQAQKGYPYLHDWFGKYSCKFEGDRHCMWDKPSQLTNYKSYGYEICIQGATKAEDIIRGLLDSKPHREVMLSKGLWALQPWMVVGAASKDRIAAVWFGNYPDDGRPNPELKPKINVSNSVQQLNDLVMARIKRKKELEKANAGTNKA